jgi:hypothetical protein
MLRQSGDLYRRIRSRKKKGVSRTMPTELITELIGKDCTVTMLNEFSGTRGKILDVHDNWIKFEEKKRIRIINADMIRDIAVVK